MIKWMGGHRKKWKKTKENIESKQREFFAHMRSAKDSRQSLDILGLQALMASNLIPSQDYANRTASSAGASSGLQLLRQRPSPKAAKGKQKSSSDNTEPFKVADKVNASRPNKLALEEPSSCSGNRWQFPEPLLEDFDVIAAPKACPSQDPPSQAGSPPQDCIYWTRVEQSLPDGNSFMGPAGRQLPQSRARLHRGGLGMGHNAQRMSPEAGNDVCAPFHSPMGDKVPGENLFQDKTSLRLDEREGWDLSCGVGVGRNRTRRHDELAGISQFGFQGASPLGLEPPTQFLDFAGTIPSPLERDRLHSPGGWPGARRAQEDVHLAPFSPVPGQESFSPVVAEHELPSRSRESNGAGRFCSPAGNPRAWRGKDPPDEPYLVCSPLQRVAPFSPATGNMPHQGGSCMRDVPLESFRETIADIIKPGGTQALPRDPSFFPESKNLSVGQRAAGQDLLQAVASPVLDARLDPFHYTAIDVGSFGREDSGLFGFPASRNARSGDFVLHMEEGNRSSLHQDQHSPPVSAGFPLGTHPMHQCDVSMPWGDVALQGGRHVRAEPPVGVWATEPSQKQQRRPRDLAEEWMEWKKEEPLSPVEWGEPSGQRHCTGSGSEQTPKPSSGNKRRREEERLGEETVDMWQGPWQGGPPRPAESPNLAATEVSHHADSRRKSKDMSRGTSLEKKAKKMPRALSADKGTLVELLQGKRSRNAPASSEQSPAGGCCESKRQGALVSSVSNGNPLVAPVAGPAADTAGPPVDSRLALGAGDPKRTASSSIPPLDFSAPGTIRDAGNADQSRDDDHAPMLLGAGIVLQGMEAATPGKYELLDVPPGLGERLQQGARFLARARELLSPQEQARPLAQMDADIINQLHGSIPPYCKRVSTSVANPGIQVLELQSMVTYLSLFWRIWEVESAIASERIDAQQH
eukprot:jgi/Mesvir1/6089/Mv00806-RA.5